MVRNPETAADECRGGCGPAVRSANARAPSRRARGQRSGIPAPAPLSPLPSNVAAALARVEGDRVPSLTLSVVFLACRSRDGVPSFPLAPRPDGPRRGREGRALPQGGVLERLREAVSSVRARLIGGRCPHEPGERLHPRAISRSSRREPAWPSPRSSPHDRAWSGRYHPAVPPPAILGPRALRRARARFEGSAVTSSSRRSRSPPRFRQRRALSHAQHIARAAGNVLSSANVARWGARRRRRLPLASPARPPRS